MRSGDALRETLVTCRADTLTARVYRAVNLDYFRTLASTVGAWRGDNRYTAANVSEAMYLAQTPDLAMLEATRQFQRAMSTPEFPAYTIIPVAVDLGRVLDMTREDNQECLETSLEELTGDWRAAKQRQLKNGRGRVVCHDLGAAAMAAGFEAIKYISAYDASRWNIVVFTENLTAERTLSFVLPDEVIALQNDDEPDVKTDLDMALAAALPESPVAVGLPHSSGGEFCRASDSPVLSEYFHD